MKPKRNPLVYQFKVTLMNTKPRVWRRIQVPERYSFWDLHVALQDSMGWLDYHLHEFRIQGLNGSETMNIGIPGDELDDEVILPGWTIPVRDFFREPGQSALYKYDFGDGWDHEVLLEGILLKEKGVRYPRCIAGERACPPEDCGSVQGYYELLEVLGDPEDDRYQDMVSWLRGHAKNYFPYNPDEFNPQKVHFDNLKDRWRSAFSEAD